jgi:rhodanese-related sulfurtransferase
MTKHIPAIPIVICGFLVFATGVVLADADLGGAEKEATVYRLYAAYEQEFPAVTGISARKALNLHQQGRVIFVDVRKPAEREISTLPGAVSAEAYEMRGARIKDKTVVAYCTIGYRSGKFAEKMAEKGLMVFNLEGGVLAWVWEGGRLQDAGGQTVKQVHVYAEKWDLAPAAYETTRFGFWQRLF